MNPLRLTLRQLQIFVSVAQTGTTTAASSEIALSQSATSAAVNELEKLLSFKLFDRSGRRLILNDNGRTLLPRALALLDGATAIEKMSRGGEEQAQALRIGASTTIGGYVLPRLLAEFMAHAPALERSAWQSRVVIGNTSAICDAVEAFELDVGLIEGPCHLPSLDVKPWLRDEMVIVGSPRHALAKKDRVTIAELRDAIWLVREPGSGTREATDKALLPQLGSYRRYIELGSSEAIKQAVAEGLGIACLSTWVVEDLVRARRLGRVRASLPTIVRQCQLVVHRQKQPTIALQEFVALVNGRSGDRSN